MLLKINNNIYAKFQYVFRTKLKLRQEARRRLIEKSTTPTQGGDGHLRCVTW